VFCCGEVWLGVVMWRAVVYRSVAVKLRFNLLTEVEPILEE
jgi:hypothetical protein